MYRHYNTRHGFTLIEVLFAILLVGVGLLGSMGYQLKAKQIADANHQQLQACQIVQDVASRVSRNRSALNAGYFSSLSTNYQYDCAQTNLDCTTTSHHCQANQLAAFDWHDAICQGSSTRPLHALPEAVISIGCDSGGNCDDTNTYRIALRWQSKNPFCGDEEHCLEQSQCNLSLNP